MLCLSLFRDFCFKLQQFTLFSITRTIPRLTSLIQNQNIQGTIVAIDFAIWFYLAALEGDLSNFPIGGGPPTLFDGLY